MPKTLPGRITQAEAAYQRLRADIVTCLLAPGQRLTERQLVAETGLGLASVRAALTRLDHDGLVQTVPRKGYRVRPLTVKSVNDLFEAWEIIGPEIVRLGITNASEAQITQLLALSACIDEVARSEAGHGTALRMVDTAHQAFTLLARATGNDLLISFYERLTHDMARIWATVIELEPDAADTAGSTTWVPWVLTNRAAGAGAEEAARYIRGFRARVLDLISRWPSIMTCEITAVPPSAADGQRSRYLSLSNGGD